jgi:hypothetical protein
MIQAKKRNSNFQRVAYQYTTGKRCEIMDCMGPMVRVKFDGEDKFETRNRSGLRRSYNETKPARKHRSKTVDPAMLKCSCGKKKAKESINCQECAKAKRRKNQTSRRRKVCQCGGYMGFKSMQCQKCTRAMKGEHPQVGENAHGLEQPTLEEARLMANPQTAADERAASALIRKYAQQILDRRVEKGELHQEMARACEPLGRMADRLAGGNIMNAPGSDRRRGRY